MRSLLRWAAFPTFWIFVSAITLVNGVSKPGYHQSRMEAPVSTNYYQKLKTCSGQFGQLKCAAVTKQRILTPHVTISETATVW